MSYIECSVTSRLSFSCKKILGSVEISAVAKVTPAQVWKDTSKNGVQNSLSSNICGFLGVYQRTGTAGDRIGWVQLGPNPKRRMDGGIVNLQATKRICWLLTIMFSSYAPWCPACKALEPRWKEFSRSGPALGIKIGAVDITASPGLSGRFMVTALPTIFQ